MKFYNLAILVEPLATSTIPAISREIIDRITTDGKEQILCECGECSRHTVVKTKEAACFPECLHADMDRLAFGISLPSKKDLGRKWFQKRLAGEEKRTFRLIAMTDVTVIHVEI